MSQSDVLRVLKKKKGKWMNAHELSKILGISTGTVNHSCRKLVMSRDIMQKEERYCGTRRMIYCFK